jgi:hypothetical protein
MSFLRLIIYFILLGIFGWYFYSFGFSQDTIIKYIQFGILGTLMILTFDELGKS